MQKLNYVVLVIGLVGSAPTMVSAQRQAWTEFDFDDARSVTGHGMRLEDEFIDLPHSCPRPVMIRIREDFVPELLRSVETL